MSLTRLALVAILAVQVTADPRAELREAIAEGIKLLEAKDHAGFLKRFLRPSDMPELLEQYGSLEKLAVEYASRRAGTMLEALRAAAKLEPEIRPDGLRADFNFPEPVAGARRVVFQKIEGRWYLRD